MSTYLVLFLHFDKLILGKSAIFSTIPIVMSASICMFVCVCYNRARGSYLGENKTCTNDVCRCLTFAMEWRQCENLLADFDLILEGD